MSIEEKILNDNSCSPYVDKGRGYVEIAFKDGHREFVKLVRKMREAQVKMYEPYVDEGWWADRAIQLSKEVDKLLEQMEV
jgi:hypothetical protein